MKRITTIACWSLTATLMTGCAFGSTGTEETESLGEAESRLEISNALNTNALNTNALNTNALNTNALNTNALNTNALDTNDLHTNALHPNALLPAALASILDPGDAGALSRQLLSYTVSCALGPTQSFVFTWLDSSSSPHQETYVGLLGLAPDWRTSPLSAEGQRWVSACLASRVNWYGTPVMLSSRGAHANLRTQGPSEQLGFPSEEGAFFGNLFQATPAVYACYKGSTRQHSRALFRDCAAGHVTNGNKIESCGPIRILGDCDDYCAPLDAEGSYHPECASEIGGATTGDVITTFLP